MQHQKKSLVPVAPDEMEEFHDLIETTSCHCQQVQEPDLQTLAKIVGVVPETLSDPADPEKKFVIGFSDPKISNSEPCLCRMAKEN